MKQKTGISRCNQRHIPLTAFCFSFLFFLLISWCAPYSSDDLEFATLPFTSFPQYLQYVLGYGNGRLLGNLCSIWLSNSRLMCILVKSAVLASVVVLMPLVLDLKEKQYYLASFLLVATVDPAIFGEVYAWTSGFSNYVPSVFLSLVIIYCIQHYPNVSSLGLRLLVCLAVFVLGVASQLFIEHSSGVNLLLSLAFTGWNLKQRDHKRSAVSGIWLLASAIGLVVMLAIPVVFFDPSGRAVNYRDVRMGGLGELLRSCAANIIQLSNHHFGACTLPMCFGAYVTIHITRSRWAEKWNRWLYGANTAALIYLVLSFVLSLEAYLGKAAIVQHVISGICAFVPFVVWAVSAFRLEGSLRLSMLATLGFAFVSLAPLLVVSPIPTRVVFQAHVFIMLGALLCLRELCGLLDAVCLTRIVRGATAVCLALVVLLGSVFVSIRFMSQTREAHIRRELDAGASEIAIFAMPYKYTTWDHLWAQAFYNDTGRDVTFYSIPFDEWMNDIY